MSRLICLRINLVSRSWVLFLVISFTLFSISYLMRNIKKLT